jgi:phosphoribosylformylglycinamidine (FGAM) synthase PurS component
VKTLEFIYQETEIHFLVNPSDKNVMVNATEMAKLFNKRIDVFLKTDHAKKFIKELEKEHSSLPPNGGNETMKVMETNTNFGTFMCEALALKFATWLDVKFEIWVYKRIQEVIFGNYRLHWQAHAIHEQAKMEMETLKHEMLTNPSIETNRAYFAAQKRRDDAKTAKTRAIRNQYSLFNEHNG